MSRFNLLCDAWIPIKGRLDPIKVCEIVQTDIIALDAPRADFNAALMQFLIGIVQTVFAPQNPREWRKFYSSPPSESELQEKLNTVKEAFYMDGDGFRFMQDISIKNNGNKANMLKLLPALVGENTIKNNMDFFLKSSQLSRMSISNTIIALYLYQNYCLSETGGKGGRHHGSMRGRNSLTTLIVKKNGNLWQTIWLNVLQTNSLMALINNKSGRYCFAWNEGEAFGKLKEDDSIGLSDLYWSMPRRVCVDFSTLEQKRCSLTNVTTKVIKEIYIKENGIEYKTNFIKHPLIPYRVADKSKKNPIGGVRPIKLNGSGVTYGDWLALVGSETASENMLEHIRRNLKGEFNILACGYLSHPTQAKTLCWYETKLPYYFIDCTEVKKKEMEREIGKYIQSSKIACGFLITAIQNAWFDESDDKNKTQKKSFKNEKASEISRSFWNRTESKFYDLVKSIYDESSHLTDDIKLQHKVYWYNYIKKETLTLFNEWAFKSKIQTNAKRIAIAYNYQRIVNKKTIDVGIKDKLNSKWFKQDILGISMEQKHD